MSDRPLKDQNFFKDGTSGFRCDMFISSDTREDLSRRLFLVSGKEEDASRGIVRG